MRNTSKNIFFVLSAALMATQFSLQCSEKALRVLSTTREATSLPPEITHCIGECLFGDNFYEADTFTLKQEIRGDFIDALSSDELIFLQNDGMYSIYNFIAKKFIGEGVIKVTNSYFKEISSMSVLPEKKLALGVERKDEGIRVCVVDLQSEQQKVGTFSYHHYGKSLTAISPTNLAILDSYCVQREGKILHSDNGIGIFDTQSCEKIRSFKLDLVYPYQAMTPFSNKKPSKKQNMVVVQGLKRESDAYKSCVQIWDIDSGQFVRELDHPYLRYDSDRSIAIVGNKNLALSFSGRRSILMFDVMTGRFLQELQSVERYSPLSTLQQIKKHMLLESGVAVYSKLAPLSDTLFVSTESIIDNPTVTTLHVWKKELPELQQIKECALSQEVPVNPRKKLMQWGAYTAVASMLGIVAKRIHNHA